MHTLSLDTRDIELILDALDALNEQEEGERAELIADLQSFIATQTGVK